MSTSSEHPSKLPPDRSLDSVLSVGIGAFAIIELTLAVFMAFAPHAFFSDSIGGFSSYNPHYIRDVASFEGALGLALLIAVRRGSWQAPVLALTAIQFALHSVNHLIDIGHASPSWTGYFDFFSLSSATVLLVWLYRRATRRSEP